MEDNTVTGKNLHLGGKIITIFQTKALGWLKASPTSIRNQNGSAAQYISTVTS